MIHLNYRYKKDLKGSIGKRLHYTETSVFGSEYVSTGKVTGGDVKHMWFAVVTMKDDIIVKVK